MPSLKEISVENVGPIGDIKVPIEPGLSVFYGLNLASGKNSENGNAVGKSLLFSSLAETIHSTPIIGERGDRIQEGVRSAIFTNHLGEEILVRRAANGRGDKLEIRKNGESLDFRTVAAGKEFIEQNWVLSDVDYSTYVHLDSRSPHPLVMGTSTQRKEFFTEFFSLEVLDAERKLYNAYLRDLKNVRAAFDEVNAQYSSIEERLMTAEERAQAQDDRDTLQDQLDALEAEVATLQNTARLIQFGKSAKGQIDAVTKAYGKITSERLDDIMDGLKDEGKRLQAQIVQAKEWANYQRDTQRYSESYAALPDNVRDAIEEHGYEKALEDAADASQKHMRIKTQLESFNEQLDKLEAKINAKLPEKAEAPAEDEEDLRVLERTYKHHLEHSKKFGSGVCDTCGQAVQTRDPEEVKDRLAAVQEKLALHRKAQAYEDARAKRKEAIAEFETLDAQCEKLANDAASLIKIAKMHKPLRDLPTPPKPFTGEKLDLEPLEKSRSDLGERVELIRGIIPHVDAVTEFLALTDEQKSAVDGLSGLTEKIRQTRDRYTEAHSKLRVEESLAEQLSDLKSRSEELSEKLKDESKAKFLVEAYSDKNIKKQIVEQIGARLMSLVNSYSQQVFEESYRFEFIWDTDISIIAHRPNGKSSDVRKLSGAESTLFTIILVCALMSFVPSKKRCNFMILDEPTSHMSAHNKEILHNALKLLTSLIPSIIIVTPKMEERYEGARAYTIVKGRDGISRLEEGHPDKFKGN